MPRLALLSRLGLNEVARAGYPAPFATASGSAPGERMLLFRRRDGTAVRCDGAGDPFGSGGAGARASFFSAGRAIRCPPRIPPSHERKQESTAPMTRMTPPMTVGRRYGKLWNAPDVSDGLVRDSPIRLRNVPAKLSAGLSNTPPRICHQDRDLI